MMETLDAIVPALVGAIAALAGVFLNSLMERRREVRVQDQEKRRLRREATAKLVVALNHVYDEVRAAPAADHEALWGDVYERFIEMCLLFPPVMWTDKARPFATAIEVTNRPVERGILRKHLDAAWQWRDICSHLRQDEPVPPPPLHEDLLEAALPYVL